MSDSILITTGARLHFGLLSNQPATGRRFGGAGLMVDRPGVTLRATVAERDECVGTGELPSRLTVALASYRAACPAEFSPPPVRLDVVSAPPLHVGLGVGTQLGLAVGRVLAELAGEQDVPASELARRVARGARSALGIHGFEQGGLIVEGGKRATDEISPLVARAVFPEMWRIVLAAPCDASGLSGTAEIEGFARLSPMPQAMTDRLCRIVLMELLPAVHEEDFESCGEALYAFGRIVGEYFAPVQGGVYGNPRMARLVEHLRAQDLRGVGQTSWGPTLFILCRDEASATALVRNLSSTPDWSDCEFVIARPLNDGANVA